MKVRLVAMLNGVERDPQMAADSGDRQTLRIIGAAMGFRRLPARDVNPFRCLGFPALTHRATICRPCGAPKAQVESRRDVR